MRKVQKEKWIISFIIIAIALFIIFGIIIFGLVNIGKAISTF
jgi:hypothetical protein